MFRTALLGGAALLAFGTARPAWADTVYYCVPNEQRATAPDRLVSVEITIKPNGEFDSVVYRAANGAAYSRGQQYEATSRQGGTEHYWRGRCARTATSAWLGHFIAWMAGWFTMRPSTTSYRPTRSSLTSPRSATAATRCVAESPPPQAPPAAPPLLSPSLTASSRRSSIASMRQL